MAFCRTLDRLFTSIPADDCKSAYTAVIVDLAGNMTEIATFDTEEEADAAADAECERQLEEHGFYGVGA